MTYDEDELEVPPFRHDDVCNACLLEHGHRRSKRCKLRPVRCVACERLIGEDGEPVEVA